MYVRRIERLSIDLLDLFGEIHESSKHQCFKKEQYQDTEQEDGSACDQSKGAYGSLSLKRNLSCISDADHPYWRLSDIT